MPIGQILIHLDSIDSTNSYALKLIAKSNPINGTVISADFQTQGRGQRNHNWQSARKKNLLLSIILKPDLLKASDQFYLSMMTANALISFFTPIINKDRLRIKWPNDIYVDDSKISGILIQNNLKNRFIDSSVIGVGINVNQKSFDPVLPNPTSLALQNTQEYNLTELKFSLFKCLNEEYQNLEHSRFGLLKEKYESALYKRGEKSHISCREGTIEAIILGIEPDGRLLVNIDGALIRLVH